MITITNKHLGWALIVILASICPLSNYLWGDGVLDDPEGTINNLFLFGATIVTFLEILVGPIGGIILLVKFIIKLLDDDIEINWTIKLPRSEDFYVNQNEEYQLTHDLGKALLAGNEQEEKRIMKLLRQKQYIPYEFNSQTGHRDTSIRV